MFILGYNSEKSEKKQKMSSDENSQISDNAAEVFL